MARPQDSHLNAMQGKTEQRTETYMKYVEGVAQFLTQQCLKSASQFSGYAREHSSAVRSLW